MERNVLERISLKYFSTNIFCRVNQVDDFVQFLVTLRLLNQKYIKMQRTRLATITKNPENKALPVNRKY